MPKKNESTKPTSQDENLDESKKDSSPNLSNISKKNIIIAVAVVLIISALFFFKSLFVAALVNGQPISRITIVKELEKQAGKNALDSLITKTLILQEAKKRNINISQLEIDNEIKKIETSLSKQGTTLDQALKVQRLTKNNLIEEIRTQIVVQKMVGSNITVSDKEVEDYINTNKDQIPQGLTPETIKAQAKQQLQQQKMQQKIQDLITQLKSKAKITYFVQY